MLTLRLFRVSALVIPLLSSSAGLACPPGGGGETAFEPARSRAGSLLQSARDLEQSASIEDARARAEREAAKRQRQIAVNFRDRARFGSQLDASLLLAKAEVADREAATADARSRVHATQARSLRTKAAQVRALAKRALVGDAVTAI